MARDESKRRDFRLSQLDDSQIRKGGYDKINKEPTVMYRCPECGHRAFQLSPRSGWYNCWACGVWGQEPRGLFQDSGFKFQGSGFKFQGSGSKVQDSGIIAGAEHTETRNLKPETRASSEPLLSDYVSLPFDVLSRIQDLSLEEQVSGAQFNVRQYLEQQKIPLQLAAKMNVGVATRAVKTKDDSADAKPKEHSCIVYRNVVDGFCCNAKYRAVSAKGFDQSSAFTPCAPYNIDCINPRRVEGLADITLYITEGEKDCLTLLGLGFIHVISAANGSQTDHAQSFGAFGEWLRPVRTVVVVGDQDMPGRKMADALADYFANKTVRVARWDQTDVVHDVHTRQDKFSVDSIALCRYGNSQCIGRMVFELLDKSSHGIGHHGNFMIESINLCCIGHDGPELIEVVIVLLLNLSCLFPFLLQPDMTCCLQHHGAFLCLEFFLCILGIEKDEPFETRIHLCRCLAPS